MRLWGAGALALALFLNLSVTVGAQIQIGEVRSGSMTLNWSAPGDDSIQGTATGYEIRVASDSIDNTNWNAATSLAGAPWPQPAGTPETFIAYDSDLLSMTGSFVALKAVDDAGLWTPLSNNIKILELPTMLPAEIGPNGESLILRCQELTGEPSATYWFELDSTNTFATARIKTGSVNGSTVEVTFDQLDSTASYFFRCRAIGSGSTESSFYTDVAQINLATGTENTQPGILTPVSPENGAIISGQSPVLTVLNGYDGDNDSLVYEFVLLGNDSQSVVSSVSNLTEGAGSTTSWTVPVDSLVEDQSYYWYARSYDGLAYSDPSPLWGFTVTNLESGNPSSTTVRDPYPSPVHPDNGEMLTFELPDEPVVVSIFDSAGDLVFRQDGATGLWQWDGRNGNGRLAAAGVYLWIVSGDRGRGKFVISR